MKTAAYQQRRQELLAKMDRLREIRDDLASRDPLFINGLPVDVRQKMLLLDRESVRLRNPDLTVAFVGGFSAGKSSLVNAFLGRYLLPESTKVTTAVPTFVRSTPQPESAELHYLSEAEVEKLGDLYRVEIASLFQMPELATAPYSTLLEKVKPLASEGRGRRLVEQFQIYQEQRRSRQVDPRGRVVATGISEAQDKIRDETEAMFLDRVVLKIKACQLPEDVVLVDLPGISVPNPRHREITFRFVKEESHALVFVLMATRLFDKDEIEIVELVRSGESRIAEKTFWVLNRWDSLSPEQQRQTVTDFENKMRDFAIPSGCQLFRTNALHGLLAQLAAREDPPQDFALQRHQKDYDDALNMRYGGSHHTALRESQVPMLQEHVLSFLNERLRKTTLRSAYENARANFCDPLPHHLRRAKEADDALLNGDLKRQEKEVSRERVDDRCAARKIDLEKQLREMRGEVAEKRSTILASKTEELLKALEVKIAEGSETDAYSIYLEIISESELRRYPYHFEIEMRIVDKLNTMLKREFREIVRTQARAVFEDYAKRVRESLEGFRKDVGYSAEVMAPFDEVLNQGGTTFCSEVDGHVKSVVGEFDKLLVYIDRTLIWWGGNQVLEGLEEAARSGSEIINNPNEPIKKENFTTKTDTIRKTLKDHYIQRVREEHKGIARNIPTLIIDNMREIQKRLLEVMQTKYRPALELIMSQEVEGEFASCKKGVEDRSRRFRDTIEQIEQLGNEMASVVAEVPA
ncbi:MAG: dynamin family protein [Pirellulales bacterium]|nr:dynamin family protein [Pirellulales bacterium]